MQRYLPKIALRIDDRAVEEIKDHAPYDTPSIIYCINHTLSKLSSTNKELKSAAIQEMQKLPVGTHYYNQIGEQQLHSSSTKPFHT